MLSTLACRQPKNSNIGPHFVPFCIWTSRSCQKARRGAIPLPAPIIITGSLGFLGNRKPMAGLTKQATSTAGDESKKLVQTPWCFAPLPSNKYIDKFQSTHYKIRFPNMTNREFYIQPGSWLSQSHERSRSNKCPFPWFTVHVHVKTCIFLLCSLLCP